MADALDIVMRIRRVTVDDAKRALAVVLSAEERARLRADAAEAAIAEEAMIAADLCKDDEAVEIFAAWLPTGRAKAATARAEHEQSRSEVSRARAALTIARATAKSAQNLLTRRAAERSIKDNKRAQLALDEVASSRTIQSYGGY